MSTPMILRIIYDSFGFTSSIGSMVGVQRIYGKVNLTTSLVLLGRMAKTLLIFFFIIARLMQCRGGTF
jgi:hypothetical protein